MSLNEDDVVDQVYDGYVYSYQRGSVGEWEINESNSIFKWVAELE